MALGVAFTAAMVAVGVANAVGGSGGEKNIPPGKAPSTTQSSSTTQPSSTAQSSSTSPPNNPPRAIAGRQGRPLGEPHRKSRLDGVADSVLATAGHFKARSNSNNDR